MNFIQPLAKSCSRLHANLLSNNHCLWLLVALLHFFKSVLLSFLLPFICGRRSQLVVEPAETYRPVQKLLASWMGEPLAAGRRLSVLPEEVRMHGVFIKLLPLVQQQSCDFLSIIRRKSSLCFLCHQVEALNRFCNTAVAVWPINHLHSPCLRVSHSSPLLCTISLIGENLQGCSHQLFFYLMEK